MNDLYRRIFFNIFLSVFITLSFFSKATSVSFANQSVPLHSYYPNENILSVFRSVKSIIFQDQMVSTVIEFPLSAEEVNMQPYILYDINQDKPVHYQITTSQTQIPVTISKKNPSEDITEMHDQNTTTFYESSANENSETLFFYTSTTPITSSKLHITLGRNSYYPTDVSIYNFKSPGNLTIVASHVSFNGGDISFPQSTSATWRISFTHSRMLRIAEMNLISESAQTQNYSSFRFLAEPYHQYSLYIDPIHSFQPISTDSVDLSEKMFPFLRIPEPQTESNSWYVKQDSDADGIEDTLDNCPHAANPDQKDSNANKIGDACEDSDHDGILNYQDNCPTVYNINQNDSNANGVGDVCEVGESTIMKQLWWLAGLLIVAGLGCFLFIVKRTMHPKQKEI